MYCNFNWGQVEKKHLNKACIARTQAQCSMRCRYVRYSTLMLLWCLCFFCSTNVFIILISTGVKWKKRYIKTTTRLVLHARTQAQCSMRSRYVRYSTLMLPTALHLMAKASRIILLSPQLFRIFQDMSDIPKNMPDIHLHISKCP